MGLRSEHITLLFAVLLAVPTSCTPDAPNVKADMNGTSLMKRLAEGPRRAFPKRVTLPGSPRRLVDAACGTLSTEPVTLTAQVTAGGRFVWAEPPSGSTASTLICFAPDQGSCSQNLFPGGFAYGLQIQSGDPQLSITSAKGLEFSVEFTSTDLDASTACVLVSSTFTDDPVITQGDNSFTITGVETTETAGGAVVNCYRVDLPTTPKPCCDSNNLLKSSGTVCSDTASPCLKAATCDGVSGECPANPPRADGTHCPWYPRPADHPYWVDASTLKRSAATEEEAAALLMVAKPAYGWPQCEGKCMKGLCALRWDHPACCAVPGSSDDQYDGRYSTQKSGTEAHPAATAVPVWGGNWRHGAGDHGNDLYCWKH